MGLDMMLMRKVYVKNWEHEPKEKHNEIIIKQNGKIRDDIRTKKIKHVVEEVMYWRKFNALHQYIVENFNDDIDDCREIYLDIDDIKKILNTLKEIKNEPKKASDLMPTQSGFFFGSTDYDGYYFKDVEDTIEVFEDLIETEEKYFIEKEYDKLGEFYYIASW